MIEKVINGGNYQPTLTDKIVLDSTPTVNSLNGVTSDAVARAVAGASGEVPAVTENDNGKVLKAIYDEGGPAVEWAEGGSDYSAGTGIAISDQGAIGVKIDGSTITTNGEGQLVAAGGGGGSATVEVSTEYTSTYSEIAAILNNGQIPYITYNKVRLWYSGNWDNGVNAATPVFTGFSTIGSASTELTVYSYTMNMFGQWVLTTKTISLS